MKSVLQAHATYADFHALVGFFNAPPVPPLVKNVTMCALLKTVWGCGPGWSNARAALIDQIEEDLGYCATHDAAYFVRRLFGNPPATPFPKIVTNVAEHLSISLPMGTTEARLRELYQRKAHETFLKMPEAERLDLLNEAGVPESRRGAALAGGYAAFCGALPHLLMHASALGAAGAAHVSIGTFLATCIGCKITLAAAGLPLLYYAQAPAYRVVTPVVLYGGFMLARAAK